MTTSIEIGDSTRTTIGFVWKVGGSIAGGLLAIFLGWQAVDDRLDGLDRDNDRMIDRIHNLEEHVVWQPPHHSPR